jgi:hypothetical protein
MVDISESLQLLIKIESDSLKLTLVLNSWKDEKCNSAAAILE